MNEQILKFAQAAGWDIAEIMKIQSAQKMQKFAELIIRECAQVCLEQRDPANLNYKPSEHFAEAVKQHFGVY